MNKRKIIIYLSLITILSSNVVSFATTSDQIESNNNKISELKKEKESLEQEKKSINNEILEVISKMEAKQEEIDVVQEKIDELQKEIDELQDSIDKTSKEISLTEDKIKENEDIYAQKELELSYQKEVLSNRLKRNYINNTYNNFLGIILDSSSMSEVLFKAKYISDIMDNDKKIIDDLNETKVELAKTKEKLDKEKESLANSKSSLEYQQQVIKEKQSIILSEKEVLDKEMSELNKLEEEKQSKIESIIKSQNYIESQIEDLTIENKTLTNILQQTSSSTGGVSYGSGTFINPTTGTYTSNYGYRIHPITGKRSFHTGQDIANSYGTKIVAADGGKVVKASYNGAYGNAIVIEHGNGYSTMYAHLQSFSVSVGDVVTQGQKIGEMGSTGWSTGPHLHYEVWYNGNHINPRQFLS